MIFERRSTKQESLTKLGGGYAAYIDDVFTIIRIIFGLSVINKIVVLIIGWTDPEPQLHSGVYEMASMQLFL